MSCDGNRANYFQHVATTDAAITQALGGDAATATAVLTDLYDLACARTDTPPMLANALTTQLFRQIQQVGLKPPTHSADGLPTPPARQGYAAVARTLQSIRAGNSVSPMVQELIQKRRSPTAPATPALNMARGRDPDAVAVTVEGRTLYVTGGTFYPMKDAIKDYARRYGKGRAWDGTTWNLPGTQADLEILLSVSGWSLVATRPTASSAPPPSTPGMTPTPVIPTPAPAAAPAGVPPSSMPPPIPSFTLAERQAAIQARDPQLPAGVAGWVAATHPAELEDSIAMVTRSSIAVKESTKSVYERWYGMADALVTASAVHPTASASPLVAAAQRYQTTGHTADGSAFIHAWLDAIDHPRCPDCGQWMNLNDGHACPKTKNPFIIRPTGDLLDGRDRTLRERRRPAAVLRTTPLIPLPVPAGLPPVVSIISHLPAPQVLGSLLAVANQDALPTPMQTQAVLTTLEAFGRFYPAHATPWRDYLNAHPTDPLALRQVAQALLGMQKQPRCVLCGEWISAETLNESHACQVGGQTPIQWKRDYNATTVVAPATLPTTKRSAAWLRAVPPPTDPPGPIPPGVAVILPHIYTDSNDMLLRLLQSPISGTTAYGDQARAMAAAIQHYGAAEGLSATSPLLQWAQVITSYQRPPPDKVHAFFQAYGMALGHPRCAACGEWIARTAGQVHRCAAGAQRVDGDVLAPIAYATLAPGALLAPMPALQRPAVSMPPRELTATATALLHQMITPPAIQVLVQATTTRQTAGTPHIQILAHAIQTSGRFPPTSTLMRMASDLLNTPSAASDSTRHDRAVAVAEAILVALAQPRCPQCGQWMATSAIHTCPAGTDDAERFMVGADGSGVRIGGGMQSLVMAAPPPLPTTIPLPRPVWPSDLPDPTTIGVAGRLPAEYVMRMSVGAQVCEARVSLADLAAIGAGRPITQRDRVLLQAYLDIASLRSNPAREQWRNRFYTSLLTNDAHARLVAAALLTMNHTPRCPDCGQFMASAHTCQVGRAFPLQWAHHGSLVAPAIIAAQTVPVSTAAWHDRAAAAPAPGPLPADLVSLLPALLPVDEARLLAIIEGTAPAGFALEQGTIMAHALLHYGSLTGASDTHPLMGWAQVVASPDLVSPPPQAVQALFATYATTLGYPRCAACGQFVSRTVGTIHTCVGQKQVVRPGGLLAPKERDLADAVADAEGIVDLPEPINTPAMADLWGRVASTIAGHPCTVVLRPGEGFATDMEGTIYADPYPLGKEAEPGHNLVVTKAGIYHEIGHELFTPPEDWATVLAIAKGEETVPGIDQSKGMLPTLYNVIEDGRMERAICNEFAGVAETLAASCVLQPRWHEQVGEGVPLVDEVIWPLLYTGLPFFAVRPEVRAAMTPQGRALFEELEPIVRAGVLGGPDDSLAATLEVAKRLEAAGIVQLPDDLATPPPPPKPGTQTRAQQGKGMPQPGQPGQPGQPQNGQESQEGAGNGQQQEGQEGQPGGGSGQGQPQQGQEGQEGQPGEGRGDQNAQGSPSAPSGSGNQPSQPGGEQTTPPTPPKDSLGGDGSGTSQRPGSTTAAPDPLSDVRDRMTPERLDDIVRGVERQAVGTLDRHVSRSATPQALGRSLHTPLPAHSTTRSQPYRSAAGDLERVETDCPIGTDRDATLLSARTPAQREIAGRLARKLDSIRQETLTRLRYETEGRLDRKRIIAATTGQETIRTRQHVTDETGMAVSVLLDQSGSMSSHIKSGRLYDAACILGQTFEALDMPYEIRGHGGESTQYKTIGDERFDPRRAARLISDDTGSNAVTAPVIGAATTALLGCETPNRLIINVMDGAMGDHDETVAQYQATRKHGILTYGVFLGKPNEHHQQQMTAIFGRNWRPIESLTDLPAVVGKRIADLFEALGGD